MIDTACSKVEPETAQYQLDTRQVTKNTCNIHKKGAWKELEATLV